MKIIKKIDDEEMIAFVAGKLSEKGMDSKYMPDAVHAFNGTVQYRKSGFGTFLKGYQKLGWIGLLVGFVLSFFVIPKLPSPYPLFGEADQGALVLNMVVEMIKFLLSQGLNINAKDAWGNTALFYAYSKGNKKIMDFLLRHGANPKIKNNKNFLYNEVLLKYDVANVIF